ncbi:efflux RND transporter permease subunit [bacterium]|nr:efflux RND transporter permease subunit [bacterium]
MNITETSLKNPYIVIALTILVAVLGLIAFFKTPVDLFPDTSPPQVLILTIEPGASAKDISDKITEIIEKEINTISGIKRIRATSRDEVSAVTAEFLYSKDINEAVTDVVNALNRIKAELPSDILPPQIYKITDATHATMTLALSPKKNSAKGLKEIRLLAENDIKDELLRIPEVGDVDIFGGYLPEVKIYVDRDKLKGYGLNLLDVISAVVRRNVTIPGGYIYTKKNEFLIRTSSEFKNLDQIKNLPIKKRKEGYILLKDVAKVKLGIKELRSLYHGNGHRAIAINILRPEDGHTLETIKAAKRYLPRLKKEYPDINFEITDDQEPIIDINLKGMRSSLIQAIILTVLIIFVFLADKRTAAIISVSIPMSFLFSLMVLKFSPYTMNMVTLSGLIIAVGMVVDASIVVLENIYRHFQEDKTLSGYQASLLGANEVALANTAGALTTIIVLIPVMFVGGYPQKVLRQLCIMISSTIFASLIASLTIVPLIASRILSRTERKKNILERLVSKVDVWVKRLSNFYISVLKIALRHKGKTLLLVFIGFVFTIKVVVPLLVGELMPPMDTGIVKITLDMPSSYNIAEVEEILNKVEKFIKKTPGFVSLSSVIGSEPGEISFGGGGATSQTISMTVNLVTRDKRKETIWQIEDQWRSKLRKIEGIRSFTVMEYGATPISTTKAPFDLILRGESTKVLNMMAYKVLDNLKGTKGLVDIRRSWYIDKPEVEVIPDATLCYYYGVDTQKVAQYIKFAVKGAFGSFMRLEDFLDIPIRIEYKEENLDLPSKLDNIYVPTRYGEIPLRSLVKIKQKYIQPFITREDLQNTIDITGVNRIYTIAQAAKTAGMCLKRKGMILPRGYSVKMSGTPENMLDAKNRLRKALMFGIILLYMLIIPMYKSFSHPVVIMTAIPLAAIGALWGLLIFDKPMCMPALMGMILLAGTVVNNSILLLDFILAARKKGFSREEAIIQSVKIRTRPILMTASSTVIGLTPLVFEMAVGLERLSPLGIVAASGLILGTFLTMVIIPVIYASIDDLKNKFSFKKRKIAGFLLILGLTGLFSPRFSFAASHAQIKEFSLKAAIEYALKNSPDIKKASANMEKAKGKKVKVRASLLPQINLNSTYTNYQEEHAIVPGIPGTEQRFDNDVISGKVEASLLLTDFGKSFYAFKAAKENYLASIKNLERRKEVIIYTVSNIYFSIVSLDKLIASLEAVHKSISELQRRVKLYLKEGKVAKIDLLKVNVRLSDIEDEIARLESKRVYLLGLLMEEMGYQGELKVSNDLKLFNIDLNKISFQSAFNEAVQHREDLEGFRYLVKSSYFGLKSSKRAYLPEIRAVAGAGEFSGTSGNAKFPGGDRWEDDYWSGVKVSFPIFDSGLRKGDVLKAKGEYKFMRAEESKILLSIYKDVRKALADVVSSEKRLRLAEVSREEAEEALRLEKLKYKEGKGVINDVLDAEAALRKADYLYYSAVSEYNTSIFEFYLAQGLLSENYDLLLSGEKTTYVKNKDLEDEK